jgi:hypothetical protein
MPRSSGLLGGCSCQRELDAIGGRSSQAAGSQEQTAPCDAATAVMYTYGEESSALIASSYYGGIAVKPRVARLEASLPTDAFWGHWLDLSQRDPRRLIFAKNAMAYLKSVSSEDIRMAAVTYLKDDVSCRLVSRRDAPKPTDR